MGISIRTDDITGFVNSSHLGHRRVDLAPMAFEPLESRWMFSAALPIVGGLGADEAIVATAAPLVVESSVSDPADGLHQSYSRTHVVILGDGMFIVEQQDGQRFFTRGGEFYPNRDGYLVNSEGLYVLGYGVDDDGRLVTDSLTRLRAPWFDQQSFARATSWVKLVGSLGTDGLTSGTYGTILQSGPLATAAGGLVTVDTALIDLRRVDQSDPAVIVAVYAAGDAITSSLNAAAVVEDPESLLGRLMSRLSQPRLVVTESTTLGELIEFYILTNRIHTEPTAAAPGEIPPGVSLIDLDASTRVLQFVGNAGHENALYPESALHSDLSLDAYGEGGRTYGPLALSIIRGASGDGFSGGITVYDSLGRRTSVSLTFVYESHDGAGASWRYFADSTDSSAPGGVLGSGAFRFDAQGRAIALTDTTLTLPLDGTGARTPQRIVLDLSGLDTQPGERGPRVTDVEQDGYRPDSTYLDSIEPDGTLIGQLFGDTVVTFGQIVLADVSGIGRLAPAGGGFFHLRPGRGPVTYGRPQSEGFGSLLAGYLAQPPDPYVPEADRPYHLVDGDGWLVLEDGDRRVFARGAEISMDADGYLIDTGGRYLMGYDLDVDGQTTGSLVRMHIPLAERLAGRPTSTVEIGGNLSESDSYSFPRFPIGAGFSAYDAAGELHYLRITFDVTAEDNQGRVWSFVIESTESGDVWAEIDQGSVRFDTDGQFVEADEMVIPIQSADGVVTHVRVDLSELSALGEGYPHPGVFHIDGVGAMTAERWRLSADGTVHGGADGAPWRAIAKLALAVFPNSRPLVPVDDDVYRAGQGSGRPDLTTALDGTAGVIRIVPALSVGLTYTGEQTDMTIVGDGMFIVDGGERFYTRDGHFILDSDNYLVTADGKYVMGYAVDAEFNLIEGDLSRLQIPLNDLVVTRQTTEVVMEGKLGGLDLQVATLGTILQSDPLTDVNGSGGSVTPSSRLVDLQRHYNNQPGRPPQQVFFEDTTLSFDGCHGHEFLRRQLDVDLNTTVQDLMDIMIDGFGLNLDPAITPEGVAQAGGGIVDNHDGTWSIQITGNVGARNAIEMLSGELWSTSLTVRDPLTFQTTQGAAGASTSTNIAIYDSLGNSRWIQMIFVLESDSNTGRTWRFFANSVGDTDSSTVLGSGTVHLDAGGRYTHSTGTTLQLDLDGLGVQSPVVFTLDMSLIGGTDEDWEMDVRVYSQDGEPAGTLTDTWIAPDGKIVGKFNSGATRVLGQVAVALPCGRGWPKDIGSVLYRADHPRRDVVVTTPQGAEAGEIIGRYLDDLRPEPHTLGGPDNTLAVFDLPARQRWRNGPASPQAVPAPAIGLVDVLSLTALRI